MDGNLGEGGDGLGGLGGGWSEKEKAPAGMGISQTGRRMTRTNLGP